MSKTKIVPVETSAEGLQLIHKLCSIALSAHKNSPSPVDIKLELAELDTHMLLKTLEQTKEVADAHVIPLK